MNAQKEKEDNVNIIAKILIARIIVSVEMDIICTKIVKVVLVRKSLFSILLNICPIEFLCSLTI